MTNRTRNLRQLTAALLVALTARAGWAGDVTNVSLSGSNLDVITAERAGFSHSYDASALTNVTLTGVDGVENDSYRARIFVPSGGSLPTDRASVVEDLALDTGFNNAESAGFDFNTPIVNGGGIDLVYFDWGAPGDPISVTINGVTHNYTSVNYDAEPGGSLSTTIYRSAGAVHSVSDLQSASYASYSSSMSSQQAVGIDLSDFGVALNATAISIRFDDNTAGSSAMDPLAVVGLPGTPGLVDDFEQDYAGTRNIAGQSGWTVHHNLDTASQLTVHDPTIASPTFTDNYVLRVAGANQDIYHAATIKDGSKGILQFDVYNPDDNGSGANTNTPDLGIGMTTQAAPGAASGFGPFVRVVGSDLQAYDGTAATFKTLLTSSFAQDTWYTIQLSIDNLADTYQVFIRGGAFSDFTLLDAGGQDTFAFRSGAGAHDLLNFYIRSNAGNSGDIAYVDNVSVVPTPAALPAGLAMFGLLATRRRRRRAPIAH